mgnify:FL=1
MAQPSNRTNQGVSIWTQGVWLYHLVTTNEQNPKLSASEKVFNLPPRNRMRYTDNV